MKPQILLDTGVLVALLSKAAKPGNPHRHATQVKRTARSPLSP
jgi:predicted nucleic acid-binding protein